MDKMGKLRKYSRLLQKYGFSETYAHNMRSCIDVVSRKRDRTVILKLVDNIDSVTRDEAATLKKLNNFFDAEVFVVFRTYKGGKAEKDMMFTRHGVDCIAENTLEDVLNRGAVPRAHRFIGERYRVEPGELSRLRKLRSMSMSALSSQTSLSKDTIYRYEKGKSFATAASVRKLEKFFNTGITVNEGAQRQKQSYKYAKLNKSLDVDFMNIDSSPFYMLGKKHSRYEVGSDSDDRTMRKVAAFYRELSETLDDNYSFFISNKDYRENIHGIPVVSMRELAKLREEHELLDIIESRKKY